MHVMCRSGFFPSWPKLPCACKWFCTWYIHLWALQFTCLVLGQGNLVFELGNSCMWYCTTYTYSLPIYVSYRNQLSCLYSLCQFCTLFTERKLPFLHQFFQATQGQGQWSRVIFDQIIKIIGQGEWPRGSWGNGKIKCNLLLVKSVYVVMVTHLQYILQLTWGSNFSFSNFVIV